VRKFTVEPVLNGYIVSIGCKVVVFDSKEKFLIAIRAYIENPDRTEKEFLASALYPDTVSSLAPTRSPEGYDTQADAHVICDTRASTRDY
jgi:hypothetical protein